MKKISEHIEIPIAVGERIYTRYGFRPILECHAADILQPDIMVADGVGGFREIGTMALAFNKRLVPHHGGGNLGSSEITEIAHGLGSAGREVTGALDLSSPTLATDI